MLDYYKILEIDEQATLVEIKKAYKKLALKYHPDRTRNDLDLSEKFKLINEAYQVLSDEDRKTGYDILRQYKKLYVEALVDKTSTYDIDPKSTYRNTKNNNPSYKYYDRKKASKENIIVSISVIISISFVLLSSFLFSIYVENSRKEARDAYRAGLFHTAKNKFDDKDFEGAVASLDTLLEDMPGNEEADLLKNKVIEQIEDNAKKSFEAGNYENALNFYGMLGRLNKLREKDLQFKIAECLEAQSLHKKAIEQYNKILTENPKDLNALYKIGVNYYREGSQLDNARKYLNLASEIATAFYEDSYGSAYTVALDPSEFSTVHFDLFLLKAKVNLDLGKLKQAYDACEWAVRLRPKISEGYLVRGLIAFEKNNLKEACREWSKAVSLGNLEALALVERNCR